MCAACKVEFTPIVWDLLLPCHLTGEINAGNKKFLGHSVNIVSSTNKIQKTRRKEQKKTNKQLREKYW